MLTKRLHGILVAAAVVGLFFGGWHTYRAVRDGKQLEISCEDFIRERPESHWVKLTNCEYDLDHYAYKESGTSVTKVYFSVRPVGDTSGTTHIFVAYDDKPTLAVIEADVEKRKPSEAATERFMATLEKPIEGMVSSGLDVDHSDRAKLEDPKLKFVLADDFSLVEQGAHPRFLLGVLLLAGSGAALILAGVLFMVARRRAREQPPVSPPTPTPPSDEPPEPPSLPPMVVRTPPT